MTIISDTRMPEFDFIPTPLGRSRQYWDRDSQCRVVVTTPAISPDLWLEFLDGARISYERHGVSKALEFDKIADGSTTNIFFAAVDEAGELLGGVRAQGPYQTVDQSHATIEWAGFEAGLKALRRTVSARIPHGIVELKSAWVAQHAPYGPGITAVIAQSPAYATTLLGARFGMATAASHVTRAWLRTGAQIALNVEGVPYPDDRYLTRLFLWDTKTIPLFAEPETYRHIQFATAELTSDRIEGAVA